MKTNTPKYDERDIMCLCPACRDNYLVRGFKVIRLNGFSDSCDICLRPGMDHVVVGILSRR